MSDISILNHPAFGNIRILPFGWHKQVADRMNCHRHTVRNILKVGESHKRFNELMSIINALYPAS